MPTCWNLLNPDAGKGCETSLLKISMGASKGIGAAIAKHLVAEGASVVVMISTIIALPSIAREFLTLSVRI
ncbi:hypothetical protein [Nostoc sp. DedQUE07]|uniref:hypothetical protein n=1 Tax=Nostoc sp. DedQUE07 TaxID=3075392 RepID=UPI002AD3CAB5|nr:hypothetical protein [Nostoc sp. DedQUE07]MDZ8131510.1 hypothetical protein [Nostoc sp. DedQUE07]